MAFTVTQSFADFRGRLEPTDSQKQDAKTKHTGVRQNLEKSLWISNAFLTGSYARSTMVRPPSDIDLFVVLDADKHANEFFYASDGAERVLG